MRKTDVLCQGTTLFVPRMTQNEWDGFDSCGMLSLNRIQAPGSPAPSSRLKSTSPKMKRGGRLSRRSPLFFFEVC